MEIQRKSAAAWFEIPCADLDRAQRFYETILGCRMAKDDFGDAGDVMCVFPAEQGGVAGALVKRAFQQPSSSVVRDSLRRSGSRAAFLRDDSGMQDDEGRLRRCRRCDVRLSGGARRCRGSFGEAGIAAAQQQRHDGLPELRW